MSSLMMSFNGDNSAGGICPGRALLALAPAPAAGQYSAAFVGEDDLARLRVFFFTFAQRCKAFTPISEAHSDGSLNRSRVKYGNGQPITNADQVAKIDQRVDAGNIAFFG